MVLNGSCGHGCTYVAFIIIVDNCDKMWPIWSQCSCTDYQNCNIVTATTISLKFDCKRFHHNQTKPSPPKDMIYQRHNVFSQYSICLTWLKTQQFTMTKPGLCNVKLEYNRDNPYRSDIIQETEVNCEWKQNKCHLHILIFNRNVQYSNSEDIFCYFSPSLSGTLSSFIGDSPLCWYFLDFQLCRTMFELHI